MERPPDVDKRLPQTVARLRIAPSRPKGLGKPLAAKPSAACQGQSGKKQRRLARAEADGLVLWRNDFETAKQPNAHELAPDFDRNGQDSISVNRFNADLTAAIGLFSIVHAQPNSRGTRAWQAPAVIQKWEAEMAHMETQASHRPGKGRFLRSLLDSAATTIAAFRTRRRTAATRRAIAGLTIDELRDIGFPLADAPAPMVDVNAVLITNLMSMR